MSNSFKIHKNSNKTCDYKLKHFSKVETSSQPCNLNPNMLDDLYFQIKIKSINIMPT